LFFQVHLRSNGGNFFSAVGCLRFGCDLDYLNVTIESVFQVASEEEYYVRPYQLE
jgi:hypothetical protein